MSRETKEMRVLIGRVIGGNVKQKTQLYDAVKKKPATNEDGSPRMNFYFQLAVPKASPELYDREELKGVFSLMIEASNNRLWPQDLNNDAYSWKCNDGDGLNSNDKPYPEYAKGCYIFHFSSGYDGLPKLLEVSPSGSPVESTNHDNFYTGVHIKAGVSFANNNQTGNTSGIYCNPEFMLLIKQDTVINPMGISLTEIEKLVGHCEQVQMVPYPGVSQPPKQAPPAPTQMQQAPPALTQMQQAPPALTQMQQAPPALTQMQQAPPALTQMQQAPPALTQMQQAPPALTQMQQATTFTMTAKANGLTREQYHAANWSDQQLIDAGMMNAPPHGTILN